MNLKSLFKKGDEVSPNVHPVASVSVGNVGGHILKDNPSWWHRLSITSKILSVFAFIVFLFILYIIVSMDRFGAAVSVVEKDKTGVTTLANTYFDFGSLSPGMMATRRINVKNEGIIPIRVIVFTGGDLATSLKASRNNFRLSTGKEMDVELRVDVGAGEPVGTTIFGKVTLIKIPFF